MNPRTSSPVSLSALGAIAAAQQLAGDSQWVDYDTAPVPMNQLLIPADALIQPEIIPTRHYHPAMKNSPGAVFKPFTEQHEWPPVYEGSRKLTRSQRRAHERLAAKAQKVMMKSRQRAIEQQRAGV